MRPRGEIAQALHCAAAQPGTVRQLCERAQVGYVVGQYTACRMVQRGELHPVDVVAPRGAGPGRPAAVLVAVEPVEAGGPGTVAAPQVEEPGAALYRFWRMHGSG